MGVWKGQDSGVRREVRGQKSGVRSQNEEHLPPAFCFLPSAFCSLPTAYEGYGMERVLRRYASPGQDVTSDSERKTGNFKK